MSKDAGWLNNITDGLESENKSVKEIPVGEVRFYPFGTPEFITYEEFLLLPRCTDITLEDVSERSIEDEKIRIFETFQTKREHELTNHWDLQEMPNNEPSFKHHSLLGKIESMVSATIKFLAIWGVLYLFIIALGIMGNAFKVLGGKSSGKTFRESSLLSNPVSGLCIGILATVLMQSSSTTTSIVISMAASNLVSVKNAANLVMGANIGTSITNTLVSIAHLNSPEQYRRAFTAAVFHDMFNWLTVSMFLPLEASCGFLVEIAGAAVDSMALGGKHQKTEFIKTITNPATGRVVSVDNGLIEKIAEARTSKEVADLEKISIIKKKSGFVLRDTPQSDSEAGILLLVVAITMLCTCLLLLVKLLQSVLKGKVAVYTRKVLNLDFQHKYLKMFGGLDNYILLFVGTGMTVLVQSSSVFTSTLTPLVGIGLIHIEKVVALTHGANIGTTVTGVISALAGDNVVIGMRVALEHVLFNCLGTVIWFVIWPLRPVPLAAAKFLGDTASNLRWFPFAYIIVCFIIVPVVVIALSIPGWQVLLAVGLPILLAILFITGWTWVRRNRADLLPRGGCLRSDVSLCGCKYPNWMQVWGGDRSQDNVDMEEMKRKEAKAESDKVTEWPLSPTAWGLGTLSLLGLLLAIPTAQWRRIRYANETRGRKEYGFGLWEICSDDFTKDSQWATTPPLCNQEQINDCAKDLSRSCTTKSWADTSLPTMHENDMYESTWKTCSKLGCRVSDWLKYCPDISNCSLGNYHSSRCIEVVDNYEFHKHNQMDLNDVTYSYPGDDPGALTPPLERTPTHASVFFSGVSNSYSVSTFLVAPKMINTINGENASCADCTETCANSSIGKFCTDAPSITGIAYDYCSGDFLIVSGRGPASECSIGTIFPFSSFTPSISVMTLTVGKNSQSNSAILKERTPLAYYNNNNTVTFASGLPNVKEWYSPLPIDDCLGEQDVNDVGIGININDIHILQYHNNTTEGVYVGSDEYEAKIVFWNHDGEIIATYSPQKTKNNSTQPNGIHIEILPSEFGSRNRESGRITMAINANKTKMVVCSGVGGSSPVVACAMLGISNFTQPDLLGTKIVLHNEASAEYNTNVRGRSSKQGDVNFVSAQWLRNGRILFLEQGKFSENKLGGTLYIADFETGNDISLPSSTSLDTIKKASVRVVMNDLKTSELKFEADPQAYVNLAKISARPVNMEKLMDLNDIDDDAKGFMKSSPIGAMHILNEYSLVLGEDNSFGITGQSYSKVHIINLTNKLLTDTTVCSLPSKTKPKIIKGTQNCRLISSVCPEGGLARDMQSIAGVVITAAVLLFIGLVAVAAYGRSKKASIGIYVAALCFSVCWILLLVAWVRVSTLEGNRYTCMFQDEALRGGVVLLSGRFGVMTMQSYSWAFTIFSWGMLTISLVAVLQHVVVKFRQRRPSVHHLKENSSMPFMDDSIHESTILS